MPRPSTTLRLGDRAPAFELRDAVANVTRSRDSLLRDRRALLLVFHRGMW
jgi:peroxiredoxin